MSEAKKMHDVVGHGLESFPRIAACAALVVAAALSARPSAGADVVKLTAGSELQGKVLVETLKIDTADGLLEVPASSIATLTQSAGQAELVLTDGTRLSGKLQPVSVSIALKLFTRPLDLTQVSSIVFDRMLHPVSLESGTAEFIQAMDLEGAPQRLVSDLPLRVEVPLRLFKKDPGKRDRWGYIGLRKVTFNNVSLGELAIEPEEERGQYGATLVVSLLVEKSRDKRVNLEAAFLQDGEIFARCSRDEIDAEEKKAKKAKMTFGVTRSQLLKALSPDANAALRLTMRVRSD